MTLALIGIYFIFPAKNAMLEINLMKPWKSLVGFVSNAMTTGLIKEILPAVR
jgi:hypothetical protein